ncbi:hypothetical protein EDC01DRAFT_635519 [Geopyxis carbonaria]|nr:hypothetical protein EDC01DRAFT_635519 [Geopyxis carbonaria]
MLFNVFNVFAVFVAVASAATSNVLLCNTRPLRSDDPTTPGGWNTYVKPLDVAGPECVNHTATLDWNVQIPFKSTPGLAKLDNVLTWMKVDVGTLCEFYTKESCQLDTADDMIIESDCIGKRTQEKSINVFFISELTYYQGEGMKCMRCGPAASYTAPGGIPGVCALENEV